jgi:hypothetical protein
MAWGESFASAWNSATQEARAVASAIATGAKAVTDSTAAAVQFIAREAKATAKAAVNMAEDAAEWSLQQGKKIGKSIAAGAIAIKDATVKGVAAVYDAAKQTFSTVVAGAVTVFCTVENWLVGDIVMILSSALSKPIVSDLLRLLVGLGGDDSQKPFDGHVLGAGCQENSPTGVMPPGCFQKPGSLPKITYVNGVNTRYTPTEADKAKGLFSGGICKTILEIAKATCSEVTGVYNATEGIGKDAAECLDNIAKTRSSPAVVTLRDMIVRAARTGQPLTLFAHSQGGLITQHAVAQAKQELMDKYGLTQGEAEQRLGAISIKSFGTAQLGWPHGPHYERFTNTADPIPPVIFGAQTSYLAETWLDSAGADQHHVFTDPHLNPIDSHSMDDTYLPKFQEIRGAAHCACKG